MRWDAVSYRFINGNVGRIVKDEQAMELAKWMAQLEVVKEMSQIAWRR